MDARLRRLVHGVALGAAMVFAAQGAAQPQKPAAKPRPKPAVASKPKPVAPKAPAFIGPLKFNDVMTSVVYRDLPALNELLALGKWPDKPDSQGRTPLTVALMLRHADFAEALLKAGADPKTARRQLRQANEDLDPAMAALLERYGRKK